MPTGEKYSEKNIQKKKFRKKKSKNFFKILIYFQNLTFYEWKYFTFFDGKKSEKKEKISPFSRYSNPIHLIVFLFD